MSDADTVLAFHGMRVSSAVVMCLITSLASVVGTYIVAHHSSQPANCASPADVAAVDTHVSQLAEIVKTLVTQTIPRNADQAHNDTRDVALELHSYIASHAK